MRDIPLRVQAAMKVCRCDTVADLARITDTALLELPNFGRTSLHWLRENTEKENPRMTPMNLHNFFGRLRSLYNVDGHMVADALSDEDQRSFVRDPVTYFIRTDHKQRQAIWREIQKRNVGYDTTAEND